MMIEQAPCFLEFQMVSAIWLGLNEGVNSVAIGVTKNLMSDKPLYDEAYFGVVANDDEILGIAIMTPPHPLNINATSRTVVPHFVEMAEKILRPNSVLKFEKFDLCIFNRSRNIFRARRGVFAVVRVGTSSSRES